MNDDDNFINRSYLEQHLPGPGTRTARKLPVFVKDTPLHIVQERKCDRLGSGYRSEVFNDLNFRLLYDNILGMSDWQFSVYRGTHSQLLALASVLSSQESSHPDWNEHTSLNEQGDYVGGQWLGLSDTVVDNLITHRWDIILPKHYMSKAEPIELAKHRIPTVVFMQQFFHTLTGEKISKIIN